MSNEVAPLFGGSVDLVDADALVKSMEETQNEGSRGGDVSYCSFSGKRGLYKIGVEGRSPNEGEPFLVAITAFELGWQCWQNSKPVATRMANISAPRIQQPPADELGPFDENKGEGWSRARAITIKSLETSEQVLFTNNSKSGVAGMADLQREVLERMKSGQDAWPVINLGMEEFEAKGFKNFKPTFEVIAWVSTDDVQKLADPEVDPMSLLDDAGEAESPAPEPRKRRRL